MKNKPKHPYLNEALDTPLGLLRGVSRDFPHTNMRLVEAYEQVAAVQKLLAQGEYRTRITSDSVMEREFVILVERQLITMTSQTGQQTLLGGENAET